MFRQWLMCFGSSASRHPIPVDFEGLPEDIWIELFLRCDDRTICKLQQTCQFFCEILRSRQFWKHKACHEGTTLCLPSADWVRFLEEETEHRLDYHRLYLGNAFGRNLIEPVKESDSVGTLQKRGWVFESGGDGFSIEHPPLGVERREDVPVCLATSYALSHRLLEIDLAKIIDPWLLDRVRPRITVREWHCARRECGGEYTLRAQLLRSNEAFARYADSPRFKVERADSEIGEGGTWQQTSITFEEYPMGMRKLGVLSSGKDKIFWAGHYGVKFANTEVVIEFPEEVRLLSRDDFAEYEPELERTPEMDELKAVLRGRRRLFRIPLSTRLGRLLGRRMG